MFSPVVVITFAATHTKCCNVHEANSLRACAWVSVCVCMFSSMSNVSQPATVGGVDIVDEECNDNNNIEGSHCLAATLYMIVHTHTVSRFALAYGAYYQDQHSPTGDMFAGLYITVYLALAATRGRRWSAKLVVVKYLERWTLTKQTWWCLCLHISKTNDTFVLLNYKKSLSVMLG